MTGIGDSPALLMNLILALLAGSLIVMAWGRRLPRQGDWVVGLGLLGLLIASGVGWSLFSEQGFTPASWTRGWIWPREEPGSITVGVLRDGLGLVFAILVPLVAATAMVGAGGPARETRVGRFYAAIGLGTAGVALAWLSLTPWLSLTGAAIAVFGGFLALGCRWDMSGEAALATRFGYERSWGLLLALLGLCILAGGHAPLSLADAAGAPDAWTPGADLSSMLGASFLFLGAAAQLQPFPLLGWVMSPSETHCTARTMMSQVFPAWAVFAILIRLEPQFREAGTFPDFGWLGIGSSVLAAVAGVFSTHWKRSLGAWLSAGFSLAVALLAFAGPVPAFCVVIGTGLAACAIAGFGAALEEAGPANGQNRQRATWAKVGCAVAAASGTGMIGFIASGGIVRAISLLWDRPALMGFCGLIFFLFAFLGWKVAWQAISLNAVTRAGWGEVIAPYVLILLSLGMFWTGTFSGGAIPESPDRVFRSLLVMFFGTDGEAWGGEDSIAPASGLYWVALAIAGVAAFVTVGRKPDFWPSVARSLPRVSAFIVSGYGVDALFGKVHAGLAWIGGANTRYLDRKLWNALLPDLMGRGLRRGASFVAFVDLRLSRGIGELAKRWVEVPAKALQLIQNGDVQWYLFFAVGSGIAILAHFMRT